MQCFGCLETQIIMASAKWMVYCSPKPKLEVNVGSEKSSWSPDSLTLAALVPGLLSSGSEPAEGEREQWRMHSFYIHSIPLAQS